MSLRLTSVLIGALAFLPSAKAQELTTYHHLEVPAAALQPCRPGMPVSLPPSWQPGDGAAGLMLAALSADGDHDLLLSTLLTENAAVLELVPLSCEGAPAVQNDLIAGFVDALEALTVTMGAGMTVALAYGSGAKAILEVARDRGGQAGAARPHYAAAIAVGDSVAAFVGGGLLGAQEQAAARLATLCETLAPVVARHGTASQASEPLSVSQACIAAIAGAGADEPRAIWPVAGESPIPADAERTAFQVTGAAGTLEMPPGVGRRRLPLVLVLHDHLGADSRSDAYAAQILGAGIAVLDLAVVDAGGIEAALHVLARDPRLDVARLGVLGFGAGARLAAELPFPFAAHALLYPGCADLGGPLWRGAEVVLMHGAADPTNTTEACAQVAQRFEAAGVRVHHRTFAGATYAWDYPPHGLEASTLLPAGGAETRVRVRPWPALVALSSSELAGFFARVLKAGAP